MRLTKIIAPAEFAMCFIDTKATSKLCQIGFPGTLLTRDNPVPRDCTAVKSGIALNTLRARAS
jgi:hypothetical protein